MSMSIPNQRAGMNYHPTTGELKKLPRQTNELGTKIMLLSSYVSTYGKEPTTRLLCSERLREIALQLREIEEELEVQVNNIGIVTKVH